MHACMHACMHANTYKYMPACLHAYVHTYIRTYIHPYIHTCDLSSFAGAEGQPVSIIVIRSMPQKILLNLGGRAASRLLAAGQQCVTCVLTIIIIIMLYIYIYIYISVGGFTSKTNNLKLQSFQKAVLLYL